MGHTAKTSIWDAVRKELEDHINRERVTCTMQLFSYAAGFFYGDDVPYFVVYDIINELAAKYGLTSGWD